MDGGLACGPVLIVSEYGTVNGGENSLLAVLPALMESGFRFEAAVPGNSPFAESLTGLGITIHPFSFSDEAGTRKTQGDIRQELADLIGAKKPSLVHCNSLASSRMFGPVAVSTGTPAVGYLRDILNLSRKAVSDINLLDRIVAVSRATREWHVERGLDAEKTVVVYNGVDPALFPREGRQPALFPDLGIEASDHIVLSIGQIGLRKGLDSLLKSVELLELEKPLHLLIVGTRYSQKDEAVEHEIQLRKSAELLSGKSLCNIHFTGRQDDIAGLMRGATLLVHTARQEPLGRVLLEACAAGLPVVATDVGGTNEIFKDAKQTGQLVPVDDAAATSSRIQELLGDPARRRTLGAANRERVKTEFTISRCASSLQDIYGALIHS